MSEMIERVARALAFSAGGRIVGPGQNVASREIGWRGDGEHFERYAELHWKEHVHGAELAIAAMREPTQAMCVAGAKSGHITWQSPPSAYETDMGGAWRAMIDVALESVEAA